MVEEWFAIDPLHEPGDQVPQPPRPEQHQSLRKKQQKYASVDHKARKIKRMIALQQAAPLEQHTAFNLAKTMHPHQRPKTAQTTPNKHHKSAPAPTPAPCHESCKKCTRTVTSTTNSSPPTARPLAPSHQFRLFIRSWNPYSFQLSGEKTACQLTDVSTWFWTDSFSGPFWWIPRTLSKTRAIQRWKQQPPKMQTERPKMISA